MKSPINLRRNLLPTGLRDYMTEATMFVIFVVFFIIMSIIGYPYFFTVTNILNVMSQIGIAAIIAIGQTYIIITAGIDLSVGSVLALSGMVCGIVLKNQQNILAGVIIALAIGGLCGTINGLLVGVARVPAFVVTLGMMSIASSLTYVISHGNSFSNFPVNFSALGRSTLFGIPYYLILIILLFVAGSFVLIKTKFGRIIYAIGSNREATRLSGVNVKWYTVLPYIITGLLVGVAAIVNSSQLMAVDPTMGANLQMDTLAAVVIGGANLMGGKGTLVGTLIGVLLIGFLRNALNIMGVNSFWQGTVVGAVIILAVLVESLRNSRQR